jgi:hypothetical protein
MKYLLIIFAFACCLRGANSTHLELAQNLEHAVQLTASGRIVDGLAEMTAQGAGSRAPKDAAEQSRKFKDPLEEMRALGSSKCVIRVSILFFGDGFFRLRVLDRRLSGAILWTFVGERDGDRWVMSSMSMTGSVEMSEILKELDAADYSKDEHKEP